MWKQRVIHQIASSSFDRIAMSQEEVFLHTLAFTTPCALHDVHNSLKWSVTLSANLELMKDVYIGIESCRNACKQIVSFMRILVTEHISFTSAAEHPSE